MRYIFTVLLLVLFRSQALPSVAVNNGLLHLYDVQPGGVYTGIIELQNVGKQTQPVRFSLNDYCTNASGTTSFDEAGSNARSCAPWISLSQDLLKLNGQELLKVAYEIRVPENFNGQGSYWSVIIVEPVSDIDSASIKKNMVGILSVTRYAIQVICHLGESGKKSVRFQHVEVERTTEGTTCFVDLENTGERYMRPVIELQFFSEDGVEAGVFKGIDQGLFPACSNRFPVDVTKLPPGNYKVVVLADCGKEDVFGTNLSLTVKDD
jgi:hypothetical protein